MGLLRMAVPASMAGAARTAGSRRYPAAARRGSFAGVVSRRGSGAELSRISGPYCHRQCPGFVAGDGGEGAGARHARNAQVHVSILRERSERCSLKLSAQRQVLTALDDAVAVVAFLDADSVPSANWLRAMVAPFADPRVGAATGIRWSAPVDAGLGTLVRHVFNALSFPQRYLYRIPWGGSLAVRKSALYETGLLDYWSRCFCEDTSAYGPLRAAGLRLAFVPAATQINTEPTDIAGAHYFMLRQIVCLRLHHVYWTLMLCVNAATALSFLICCLAAFLGIAGAVLALVGIAAPFWKLTAFAIIPALYVAGLIAALAVGDHLVRRTVSAPPRRVSLPKLASAIFIALSHATYAVFKAPFLRSIAWRGITYDIEGRDRIRMRAYQPYCAADDGATAARSIL
jgi:hypothetical protein